MKFVLSFTLGALLVLTCSGAPAYAQESDVNKAHPGLEKQLFEVEQKWLHAEHDKDMATLGDLWTNQFFDDLAGGVVVNKPEMMERLSKTAQKPGTGAFPDDFKLRAVYGNVALATDHTTLKGLDAQGNIVVTREMRVLRMFVKENGKWKVAGAGLVPISK